MTRLETLKTDNFLYFNEDYERAVIRDNMEGASQLVRQGVELCVAPFVLSIDHCLLDPLSQALLGFHHDPS